MKALKGKGKSFMSILSREMTNAENYLEILDMGIQCGNRNLASVVGYLMKSLLH